MRITQGRGRYLSSQLTMKVLGKENIEEADKRSTRGYTILGMVEHIFTSNIWEAEVGRCLWIWGQPGLQRKFKDSQGR